MNRNAEITIVLICSGDGSNTKSYRPSSDESQWWGRRDALVRCVTAALFSQDHENGGEKKIQLILLFDGDGSMMVMNRGVEKSGTRTVTGSNSNHDDEICDDGCSGESSKKKPKRMIHSDHRHHYDYYHDHHTQYDDGKHRVSSEWIPSEMNVVSKWREASVQHDKSKNTRHHHGHNNFINNISTIPFLSNKMLECKLVMLPKLLPTEETHNNSTMYDPITKENNLQRNQQRQLPKPRDISNINSKRELLQHIQKRCPFDFMKSVRLNSSTDVILRKFNKNKLENIWIEWCDYQKGNVAQGGNNKSGVASNMRLEHDDGGGHNNQCQSIPKEHFQYILSTMLDSKQGSMEDPETKSKLQSSCPSKGSNTKRKQHSHDKVQIIASFLHESCDSELPVCSNHTQVETNDIKTKLIVFMGAVRDMTDLENENLASACTALNIPLVGCRLGPVAEFTSKILQVLTYHAAHKKLIPAMHRRCEQCKYQLLSNTTEVKTNKNVIPNKVKHQRPIPCSNKLHFVVNVPFSSDKLTSKLSERSSTIWRIVRITVCALWRSRVASSRLSSSNSITNTSHSSPLMNCSVENILTFAFEDGLLLTIDQTTLVDVMAEKHQAAPSEYQILEALIVLRDKAARSGKYRSKNDYGGNQVKISWDGVFSAPSCSNCVVCALDLCINESKRSNPELTSRTNTGVMNEFYAGNACTKKVCCNEKRLCHGTLLVLLHLEYNQKDAKCFTSNCHSSIVHSLNRANIPIILDCIVSNNALDCAALSVTMLQHLAYQDRLFCCLNKILTE